MIDWDRLNELRSEIGAEDLADVASIFLEEADEVMEQIAAAGITGAIEGQLHFLKGSALNLGLSAFAGICQDGEKKAAAGHPDPVDLAALESVYLASKAAFLGALAKSNAA